MRKFLFYILIIAVGFLLAKLFLFKDGEEVRPGEVVKVAEIRANARNFDQKIVTVSGTVLHSGSVGLGGYTLDDGTGTIIVLTTKAVPVKGDMLKVRGKITEAIKVGSAQQMALKEIDMEKTN